MLYPQTNAIRLKTSLDGLWQWYLPSEDLRTEWIYIPGHFNRHPKLLNQKKGIWIKTDFYINTMQLTQRLSLCFSSISHSAVIYINGQAVATHEGAGIPFEVTINDVVAPGVNELKIYVSRFIDQHSLSGVHDPKDSDFWGIDGHVWLQTTSWSYLDNLQVKTMTNNHHVITQVSSTFIGDVDQINWYLYHKGKLLDESVGQNAELTFNGDCQSASLEMTSFQIEMIASVNNLPVDHYICDGGYHPLLLKEKFCPERIFCIKDESSLCDRLLYGSIQINEKEAILVHPSGYLTDIFCLADRLRVPLILELPPFPESSDLSDRLLREKLLTRLIEWHHHHPSLTGWSLGDAAKSRLSEEKDALRHIIKTRDPMRRPVFERNSNVIICGDVQKELSEK